MENPILRAIMRPLMLTLHTFYGAIGAYTLFEDGRLLNTWPIRPTDAAVCVFSSTIATLVMLGSTAALFFGALSFYWWRNIFFGALIITPFIINGIVFLLLCAHYWHGGEKPPSAS